MKSRLLSLKLFNQLDIVEELKVKKGKRFMENIKIERNIPLPIASRNGIYEEIVNSMAVGDSFVIPEHKRASYICALNYHGKKLNGSRYISRRISGNNVRIWRTV